MQDYTEQVSKFPNELQTEAEGEIKAGTLMRQRKIKSYLISFRKYLQYQELSDNTISPRIAGLKSFYKLFEMDMTKQPKLQLLTCAGVKLGSIL